MPTTILDGELWADAFSRRMREEAARELAETRWLSNVETNDEGDGITVIQSMFISNEEIDAYLKEQS